MAEWFKAVDCKSIDLFRRRFKSYFFLKKFCIVNKNEIWRSGSVSVLGTGSHGFKSHYFD